MSDLFPHNSYDSSIINQPEIEYRTAKYPFCMRHKYIDSKTGEGFYMDTQHCPVCFWNQEIGMWESALSKEQPFCSKCGQKIRWDGLHTEKGIVKDD
jgi:endogenous inhibitor of DNA gyrase (YacG/DUF329 family)